MKHWDCSRGPRPLLVLRRVHRAWAPPHMKSRVISKANPAQVMQESRMCVPRLILEAVSLWAHVGSVDGGGIAAGTSSNSLACVSSSNRRGHTPDVDVGFCVCVLCAGSDWIYFHVKSWLLRVLKCQPCMFMHVQLKR